MQRGSSFSSVRAVAPSKRLRETWARELWYLVAPRVLSRASTCEKDGRNEMRNSGTYIPLTGQPRTNVIRQLRRRASLRYRRKYPLQSEGTPF